MRGALVMLAVCGLWGCESAPEFPPGQPFTFNGNSWTVSDVRGEGRLDIVAVDPKLAGLGNLAEMRHRVGTMPPAEYRAATMGWFATSGRFCTPDQGTPDGIGGMIYSYSCWHPS